MKTKRHDVYHEHRWEIEPTLVFARSSGMTWEVTEVRATITDDEFGIEHSENIDFYGFPLRKDGVRAATVFAAKLVTGIDLDRRLHLEAEVYEWLGLEHQP